MRTSESRFYTGDSSFKGADGILRAAKVFSYESQRSLYDVLVIEGMKFVRVNNGQISNMISNWKPHHYAIENHFNL